VIESGRDDTRLDPLLPESSQAPIPQSGVFQWNKYLRGSDLHVV